MQEMAENLERIFNKRSFEKSEFTLDFLLKILKQCHKDENEHEAATSPFRDNSEYKRSTEETNAIAKKFKIAKRMKLMIRSLGSKDMDRSTTSIIDEMVDSSCRHLLRKGFIFFIFHHMHPYLHMTQKCLAKVNLIFEH